jgi:NAD(P)H-quinone oxidoreductase subunit 5
MTMSSFFVHTVWLVPLYTLFGALFSILWLPAITRRTGPRPAGYVNLIATLLAFVHSALALPGIWNQAPQRLSINWLDVAGLHLTLPLEISGINVAALVVVTGLNLLAQLYAVGYLEMDWGWGRFFAFLAYFEGGMSVLALSNSLFFTYIVLEVLTLGTYLLVGFWFNQSLVVTGARDAFLTKRAGDLILLMGVIALLPLAGTWDFTELTQWATSESTRQYAAAHPTTFTLLGLALIAGPMGKCAQFPLHLWLDEAMEGPLPSTILRNGVVVATGAWVLIKLQPIIALSPTAMTATVVIGAVTAVGASLIAIAQIDIKRALSYSVSASMGLVFIAVGTLNDDAAYLLLLSHAVAMGLLVMSIGGIVLTNITQDLTQLGGLWSRRPITAISYLLGGLGLIGFPPFGGFWAILKLVDGLWDDHPLLLGIVLIVDTLTAFSLTREFGLVFMGKPKQMSERSPESHWTMAFPMVVLVAITLHVPIILHNLSLLPDLSSLHQPLLPLVIWSTVSGIGIGGIIYLNPTWKKPVQLPFKPLQDLLAYDFYTPQLYRYTIVLIVGLIAKITDWLDRNVVDGLVNLIGLATMFSGQGLKYNVSGQSQFYVLTIVVGLTVFLGLLTAGLLNLSF